MNTVYHITHPTILQTISDTLNAFFKLEYSKEKTQLQEIAMQIVPSLLFGISASLDALLVGITFGVRSARINLWQNLLISTITLLGTCLSVALGAQLTLLLPANLWKLSGSLILILFGVYYIIKFMIEKVKKYHHEKQLTATQAPTGKKQPSSAMTFPEACTLGCALSANNMGIGLSASIAGMSMLPAATVTLLFSIIFLYLGNRLGMHHSLQLTESTTNIVSGLLLIGLGILQFLNG